MKKLLLLTCVLWGAVLFGSELCYTLDGKGLPEISVEGKKIVRISGIGFTKNWGWAGFYHEKKSADEFAFKSPKLEIVGSGQWRFAPNRMICTYRLKAGADMPEAIGCGYSMKPALNDPAFGGRDGTSVLLPDHAGWEWEVAPGKKVVFRFSPGLANVDFERGNHGEVRCYVFKDGVKAGLKEFTLTVELPPGSRKIVSAEERYGSDDHADWFKNPLALTGAFVDLSHLNHKPAGKYGFVETQDGRFVLGNGETVRFWGCNIQAYSLFIKDKELIRAHARRIARLGFNLVRLHHHDSAIWVRKCLIKEGPTSQEIDPEALDSYFYWIKCLKEEGLYVWIDLQVGRPYRQGDDIPGFEEIFRKKPHQRGVLVHGYNYVNQRLKELMKAFNEKLLTTPNPYTGLTLANEPAVMGMLVCNENDLSGHFGNAMLADKKVPYHNKLMFKLADAFAEKYFFDPARVKRFWQAGESKLFLNDLEATWNREMIAHLRSLGIKVPICAGHIWGGMGMSGLPSLTTGDIIDTHSYEPGEFLVKNPRYNANFATSVIRSHVAGMPLSITEYNATDHAPYAKDPFTIPLYLGALAAFQGIDAPMLFAYSQDHLSNMNPASYLNNAYKFTNLIGLYPAAALLFRRDVSPAKETWTFTPGRDIFMKPIKNPRAFSTIQLRHRLEIAMPKTEELPWLKASAIPKNTKTFADPDKDFIPAGQTFVNSDTGELRQDWRQGVFSVNTARSQGVVGWLKEAGKIELADVSVASSTAKAAVILSSLDGKALNRSGRILVSTAARTKTVKQGWPHRLYSEPVAGTITLKNANAALTLVPLKGDGTEMTPIPVSGSAGTFSFELPTNKGTHWFLLKPAT